MSLVQKPAPDFKAMAKEELPALRVKQAALEEELKVLLLQAKYAGAWALPGGRSVGDGEEPFCISEPRPAFGVGFVVK